MLSPKKKTRSFFLRQKTTNYYYNVRRKYFIWKLVKSVNDITEENIRIILKGAPIKSKQDAVSIPMVKRYYSLLENKSKAPPIRIRNGAIVEGNHRYVAGLLHGTPPDMVVWHAGFVWDDRPTRKWEEINCDSNDWNKKY